MYYLFFFFFSSRRRHTRLTCDWSSDVCSSDLIFCKSRTKYTKSATSTIVDHTCSCDSTQARWTLAGPVCIGDSMVGLSPGNDFTARDVYSIRRSAKRLQSGRTAATSECSRTLSSGLCEGRPSRRRDVGLPLDRGRLFAL